MLDSLPYFGYFKVLDFHPDLLNYSMFRAMVEDKTEYSLLEVVQLTGIVPKYLVDRLDKLYLQNGSEGTAFAVLNTQKNLMNKVIKNGTFNLMEVIAIFNALTRTHSKPAEMLGDLDKRVKVQAYRIVLYETLKSLMGSEFNTNYLWMLSYAQ